MKNPFLFIFTAVLALFTACQKNGADTNSNSNIPFQLSEKALTFTYNGGEQTLTITSNTQWSIQSTAEDWLSVSPSSGNGNGSVKVTAAKNPSKENNRSAKLVCSYNNLSMSMDVTQEKSSEEPVFSITPASVEVDALGEQFSIVVVSDAQPYDITIVDEWISLVSQEGDRHTGETIVFNTKHNPQNTPRNGVISVCTENGSCIPVMVTQKAGIARHHAGYRFTATWCGYCPYMDEAFHSVASQRDDFDFVTFHASYGYPLYLAACEPLVSTYHIEGFPTGVLNGWQEINNYTSSSTTANNIIKAMDSFDNAFPCLSDITFTSAIEDGSVAVNAQVTSNISGDLKVVALLLESGIVQEQAYYPATGSPQHVNDFVHDNVARAVLTQSIQGDSVTAIAGEPVSLQWSMGIDSAWNAENLSVFVGVIRNYSELSGDKAQKNYPDNYIENCRLAPVGQTVTE